MACRKNFQKPDFHEVITAKKIYVAIKFRSVHLEVRVLHVRGTGTSRKGTTFFCLKKLYTWKEIVERENEKKKEREYDLS